MHTTSMNCHGSQLQGRRGDSVSTGTVPRATNLPVAWVYTSTAVSAFRSGNSHTIPNISPGRSPPRLPGHALRASHFTQTSAPNHTTNPRSDAIRKHTPHNRFASTQQNGHRGPSYIRATSMAASTVSVPRSRSTMHASCAPSMPRYSNTRRDPLGIYPIASFPVTAIVYIYIYIYMPRTYVCVCVRACKCDVMARFKHIY